MMQEKEILALARRRAQRAEVFAEETDRTRVEFRAGRFHAQEVRLSLGHGLRLVVDGRIGFSSTTDPERLDKLVGAAVETARYGRECRFEFPGPADSPAVRTMDNRVMLVTPARMREWGEDLVRAMRARVKDLKLDLTFRRTYTETVVANSEGLEANFQRVALELDASGLLVDDGFVWLPDYVNLSDGGKFDIEPLCDRLEALAGQVRERARLASGTWPVVVMPRALAGMLVPLEVGTSGRTREKGTSPLIGREGEQVIGERLTVVDNPLRPGATGSSPFDDEGVPRRWNALFEAGKFRGFLHDLATAAACDTETTGSARRYGYAGTPVPGRTNLEIEPGDADLATVVGELDQGLVVHDVTGAGQSNLLAGEVAVSCSTALKVEAGKVVGRVKDAMLAGNIYEMLKTVDRVGKEQQDLGDSFLPFLRFPGLKVATKD
jgi:PmbA protein